MGEAQDRRKGVWVAYHDDWSGAAVFASEVACLRHAVDNSMSASFVEYGIELREAVKSQGRTRLRPKRKPKAAAQREAGNIDSIDVQPAVGVGHVVDADHPPTDFDG